MSRYQISIEADRDIPELPAKLLYHLSKRYKASIDAPPPAKHGLPRLGFIVPTLGRGGAEIRTVSHIANMDRSVFQPSGIAVFTGAGDAQLIARAMQVSPAIYSGSGCLRRIAAESDILVVWAMGWCEESAELKEIFGGPVVLTADGAGQVTINDLAKSVAWGTHNVAVSKWAARAFPDGMPVDVIHSGCDPDRCMVHQGRDAIRNIYGLQPGDIAVGYVGRMHEVKNPLAVAKAVARLGPPYRAVYSGGGPDTERWINEARRICPDLIYMGVSNVIGDVYASLDCSVHASPSEGFSLSLLESMLCGCPAASTLVGGLLDMAEQYGQLCATVPIDPTPDHLAEGIVLATSGLGRERAEHARRVVSENYLVCHMAARWRDYLLRIL